MVGGARMSEMGRRIITCRELDSFLADYVAGDLQPGDRALFEEHLALCPTCVRYVEQYRHTIALGRAAFREPDVPPPDDVPPELIEAIVAARNKGRPA